MQKFKRAALLTLLLTVFLLSACAQEAPNQNQMSTAPLEQTLRPYPTNTDTATPLPTDYASPTPSPTVTPTPTQVFYDVQQGDDMYSIAFRYNLSPSDIMTANPTVNPRAMSVGTTLLIPITPMPEGTATPLAELSPTPTPLYSALNQPDCYRESLGGLWCFALVENEGEGALENVSGLFTLQEGEGTRQEVALMPLNLLPQGETLPLIAYFQAPVSEDYTISVKVDFLLPVMPGDERYLNLAIEEQSIILSEDGQVAQVTGELTLPAGGANARYVWVNGTAFDEEGHVVAVRRWDREGELSAGENLPFEFFLYSLGAAIDHVDLLVEAQPDLEPIDTPEPH